MTRWNSTLLQVSMFLVSSGCSRADAKLEEQAAGLLLQRYETVVAVRSVLLPRLRPNPNQEMGPKSLGLPFVYLMAGLKAVSPNALGIVEKGSDVVLTGAKDFVAPEGLGMVTARTSTIAVLTPNTARTLTTEFSKIMVASMDGTGVWSWSSPLSEGYKTEMSFYAAIVASSFFVIANDATEFREVANALQKGTTAAPLPLGVTSLRAHAYWASRTIRRSPPADYWATGLTQLPASTVGLQLFTEFDDGKLVFNILIPDDSSGAPPIGLPSSESIRFKRASPGRWEAIIPLGSNSQTTAAIVKVLYYFGYGLAL
jgi:hypothetical protein